MPSRRLRAVPAALATLALVAACGGSGGDTELTMIGYGGALAEPYERFLIEPFERDNPGTSLEQVPSESGDFVAQIRASAADSPYDVVPLGESRLVTAIEEGWVAPVGPDEVPALDEMQPTFADSCRGYGVPTTYSLIGLAYDPDRVPAPTSWESLWDPAYSGQVGLVSSSSNLGFAFFVQAARLAGGSEADLEPGFGKIAELGDFTVAANPTALGQLFEQGEIAIAPLWNNEVAVLEQRGVSVAFVKPPEGPIADVTCMTRTAGTAQPELATDLLRRAGSAEFQGQAAAAPWFFGPTNQGAPVEPSPYLLTEPTEYDRLARIDWTVAAPQRNAVSERFNREFGT